MFVVYLEIPMTIINTIDMKSIITILRCLLATVLLLSSASTINAQSSVGYLHKLISDESCYMNYSVAIHDSTYYVVVSVQSSSRCFLNEPSMKIRTFAGDVITLKGEVFNNGCHVTGKINNEECDLKITNNTNAQFPITPAQLRKLNSGVAKLRISMYPFDHEHEFKNDKIGKRLYELFLIAKEQYDNF